MELVKLVNRGLAGEPEILCFQNESTLKIYDFSEIKDICVGGEFFPFIETDWMRVLENENHIASIDVNENGNLVLHV